MRVAESAREAIENLQIRQGDGASWPYVTISGGIAVFDGRSDVSLQAVIAAADEAGIAMVFTGMRHFRH